MQNAQRKQPDDAPSPSMGKAQHLLETVFGYKAFRSHQADIVAEMLAGRDVLALMPTGGGKSLCYQIPALVREGTGIIVSPLIALMQDQVGALRELGVKAAFLNSSLSHAEAKAVEWELVSGNLDMLYVAPERLVQERMHDLLAKTKVALFAIDEAHCVSAWGHDFRTEYRQLRMLAERYPSVPRIALTATADERTREDIVSELNLQNARRFVASFDRPNIRYTIAQGGNMSGREQLAQFIAAEHQGDAGVVYCLSRKNVEETAAWLSSKGHRALAYHAGLSPDIRRSTQEKFLSEEGLIVVATIAFGMGIDKPDVRFVGHLNLPKSIESYYQETGRAGRDGEPADAWMSFGMQDIVTQRQWIADSDAGEAFKQVQRSKLDALVGLTEIVSCRRQSLLAYFGEAGSPPCGNCDNCLTPPETVDMTEAARKALSAVYRTEQRFGMAYVIDVLLAKDDERIGRNGHDRLAVFGIGKGVGPTVWRDLFRQLEAGGYLVRDEARHGALVLTDLARPIIRGEQPFLMRKMVELEKSKRGRDRDKRGSVAPVGGDGAVFAALKALRLDLAKAANVPPYVICHDRTITELAEKRPRTTAELSAITGLGERKIARYGEDFLATIARFKKHPLLENRLSGTINQTLALHVDGKTAEEIAAARNIEVSTVRGHFAEAIEAGLLEARAVIGLEQAQIDEILAVFERCNTLESGKLGPAHAALEGRYDYGILKCLLAEME